VLDIATENASRTALTLVFLVGYINRLRGYHSQKAKLTGWEKGQLNSYYYVPMKFKNEMRSYMSIKGPIWGREFPVGWRDIDHDLLPEAFSSMSYR
jgi:hypothetical protein